MSPSTLAPRRIRRIGRVHRAVPPSEGPPGRLPRLLRDDAGMSTVEYAIGCIAAAAFAAVLYAVVNGDAVTGALTQLVQRALSVAL